MPKAAIRIGAKAILAFWGLIFVLSVVGFLVSCGAPPSSGVALTPSLPVLDRDGLLFGYYGGCATCAIETHGHVNLYWAGNLYGLLVTMEELFQAKAAGIQNVVLAVPAYAPNAELEVRFHLKRLQEAGLLVNVRALYPIDEPDLNGKSAEEVRAVNAMVRRVAAEFPELAGVKLAVIYAAPRVRGDWPGIEAYDWVGFDDYDNRDRIFGNGEYFALKQHLTKEQRILLVPGGVDPWRQDPGPFVAQAQRDDQVVAIIPFIWQDNADRGLGLGIRSNGMRGAYCAAGKAVIHSEAPC